MSADKNFTLIEYIEHVKTKHPEARKRLKDDSLSDVFNSIVAQFTSFTGHPPLWTVAEGPTVVWVSRSHAEWDQILEELGEQQQQRSLEELLGRAFGRR